MKLSSIKKIDDLGRLLNAATLWFVTGEYPYDVKVYPSGSRYVTVDENGTVRLVALWRSPEIAKAIGHILDVFDDELEAKKFASARRLKYLREELAKEKAKKKGAKA